MVTALPTLPGTNILGTNIAVRLATEGSIIHPTRGRIPFRPRQYQTRFWLDKSRFRVVLKARQIGMSQAVAGEALYKAMLIPNRTILFISKNGPDAIRLLKQARDIYEMLPHPPCPATKSILNEMHFANGSQIISVAAQRNAGRGYPASDIYLDECAFLQFAEDIYLAVAPAIAQGGTLTVLSTPNGQNGLFYDLWMGVKGAVRDYDGTSADGEWSRHVIPFWQCPTYDEAWYRANRPKYTSSQFASEFECSFEASGDPVFRAEALAQCGVGWNGLMAHGYPHGLYVTAWDIARRNDWLVGITLDITTRIHHVVAYERYQGIPFPIQQQMVHDRWRRFPGIHVIEANNQGDAVIENLPAPCLPWVIPGLHLTQMVMAGIPLPIGAIVPFQTQVRSKENIITALQLGVESYTYKFGAQECPNHLDELRKYTRADKGLVQDTVMAAAIAEWASTHLPVEQTYTYEDRTDISGWDTR